MKRLFTNLGLILFVSFGTALIASCDDNNSQYTSKYTMKKLYDAKNLKGMYMDEFIENFGKPYKVEDSIIHREFNYRDLSTPFKDNTTITFTYMRPLPKNNKNGYINEVIVVMFIQSPYTLDTPAEAIWTVYSIHK